MERADYELTAGGIKLVFHHEPELGGYGYTLHARRGAGWRAISAGRNPLVRGASFDLYPQMIERAENGALLVRGHKTLAGAESAPPAGGPAGYDWSGRLATDPATGWIEVNVTVAPEADLTLRMAGGFEPELTIDMGALPPYERGDHVWFKISINNPTRWNDEAQGNDLPALYYFDAYHHYEVMMFHDMTAMSWMSRCNIARFLNYRCGFRRRYRPEPAFELGLYADGYSGQTFPAGAQAFRYFIRGGERAEAPTEQRALVELVERCAGLIGPESVWPPNATDWEDFTRRCAEELMLDGACWSRDEKLGLEYLMPYVNGSSPAWEEAHAAKGLTVDMKGSASIDAAAFLGYPLTLARQLRPEAPLGPLLERVLAFLEAYARKRLYDQPPAPGFTGSWQSVYIIEQLWQIARLNGMAELERYAKGRVEREILPMAHRCGYVFPLCYDRVTLARRGNGDTHGVGGVYAYLMLSFHEAYGDGPWLEEARRALRVLANLPVNSLNQESFLLAIGAHAAAWLYELTGEEEFRPVVDYLLAQNLRQMYWFDDRTAEEYRHYRTTGMYDACTPMLYPAFFENVECLARINSTFALHEPSTGLLNLVNRARKNNFSLFPRCLPESFHLSDQMYVPLENLGLLEIDRTGFVGQEIYGAGQVFRAWLLWEALAKASDRDVMVLSLDGYRRPEVGARRRFLVYNPERESITISLEFQFPVDGPLRIRTGGRLSELTASVELAGQRLELTLAPGEKRYLALEQNT